MSDLPSPDEVEATKAKGKVVAGLVREHYEALVGAGFNEDEAFELAQNYHWRLLGGGEDE